MENLRQRVPYIAAPDDPVPEEETAVLDEQQQEFIINILKERSEKAERIAQQAFRLIIVVSTALQLNFLVNVLRLGERSASTPLAILFGRGSASSPLIPFAGIWTLIAIGVHILDIITINSRNPSLLSAPLPLIPRGIIPDQFNSRATLYLVAPALAITMRKDIDQILWWFEPAIVLGMVAYLQKLAADSQEDMRYLHGLRYDARGA